MTTLILPRSASSAKGAQYVMARVPADVTVETLTLDASKTATSSKDFTDELLRQIFETREAEAVVLKQPDPMFKFRFIESAKRADRAHFVTVIDR